MPKDAFSGKLAKASDVENASPLTSPDAAWLRFVQRMTPATALGTTNENLFTAEGFVQLYEKRRANFEKSDKLIVKRS
jgi:hypothetical protein